MVIVEEVGGGDSVGTGWAEAGRLVLVGGWAEDTVWAGVSLGLGGVFTGKENCEGMGSSSRKE